MGTRADFYVGKGKSAEWIGSIAWDGYREGIPAQILNCQSDAAFRHAVQDFLKARDDAKFPNQGWPWPWNDSSITDCSYWFFDFQCWDEHAGVYVPCDIAEIPEELTSFEAIEFPDMSARKSVTLGERSGLIVVSAQT